MFKLEDGTVKYILKDDDDEEELETGMEEEQSREK